MMSEGDGIAIVGMSGRFPGARDVDELWDLLCHGREAAAPLADQDLLDRGVSASDLEHPHYVKHGSLLAQFADFDAEFFGYSAKQAANIDPQQRIFLEAAWSALEAAGCDPARYEGSVGVFAGSGESHYLQGNLAHRSGALDIYQATLDGDKDFLTTRTSYKLNLSGPSIAIQTACSSSLVAVHYACQSLLNFECDLALAGGVSIRLPQGVGYMYVKEGIASPDGKCRAFDANAQGTFPGSGVGVVVLKRLSDALVERDHIHAVIKGSAVNNDGARKAGFTAPSVAGQRTVIETAQLLAGVEHVKVGMVEGHGTGTVLGDAIEVTALKEVFDPRSRIDGRCALGSIKSNIGHLEAASGIAGLIKAALCVEKGQFVPSLNVSTPNPALEGSAFFVPDQLLPWQGNCRYAGVSSFGIGGTNAHVVIGNHQRIADGSSADAAQLFPLSAANEIALVEVRSCLADHLERNRAPLADVARTLQHGRRQFLVRQHLIAASTEELARELRLDDRSAATSPKRSGVAFMFTGQGAEMRGIAAKLYAEEPVFAKQLDRCAHLFLGHLGIDVRTHLCDDRGPASSAHIQSAAFSLQYSLAGLWAHWGIVPAAVVGHSVGEYAAACIAGMMSLGDAARVLAARARLLSTLPQGRMIAIALSEQQCRPFCTTEIAIAAINAPFRCVLSGPAAEMERLESRFTEQRVGFTRLSVDRAFHSPAVEAVIPEFRQILADVVLPAPQCLVASTVDGRLLPQAGTVEPHYWERHMRVPTRFSQALLAVKASGVCSSYLEIGAGQALTQLAHQNGLGGDVAILPSLPGPNLSGRRHLLGVLGRLWEHSDVSLSEAVVGPRPSFRTPLPTYRFQRRRYWVDHVSVRRAPPALATDAPVVTHGQLDSTPTETDQPPLTELEAALIGILKETLGVSNIGLDNSFFDLGGDSLMGLSVIRKIQDELGLEVSIQDLLGTNATVAMLRDAVLSALERLVTGEEQ